MTGYDDGPDHTDRAADTDPAAREMEALFAAALADEPASDLSALSVLRAARSRTAATPDPAIDPVTGLPLVEVGQSLAEPDAGMGAPESEITDDRVTARVPTWMRWGGGLAAAAAVIAAVVFAGSMATSGGGTDSADDTAAGMAQADTAESDTAESAVGAEAGAEGSDSPAEGMAQADAADSAAADEMMAAADGDGAQHPADQRGGSWDYRWDPAQPAAIPGLTDAEWAAAIAALPAGTAVDHWSGPYPGRQGVRGSTIGFGSVAEVVHIWIDDRGEEPLAARPLLADGGYTIVGAAAGGRVVTVAATPEAMTVVTAADLHAIAEAVVAAG